MDSVLATTGAQTSTAGHKRDYTTTSMLYSDVAKRRKCFERQKKKLKLEMNTEHRCHAYNIYLVFVIYQANELNVLIKAHFSLCLRCACQKHIVLIKVIDEKNIVSRFREKQKPFSMKIL